MIPVISFNYVYLKAQETNYYRISLSQIQSGIKNSWRVWLTAQGKGYRQCVLFTYVFYLCVHNHNEERQVYSIKLWLWY